MVRLTAELILTSPAFVNPLKERELDLRGARSAPHDSLFPFAFPPRAFPLVLIAGACLRGK